MRRPSSSFIPIIFVTAILGVSALACTQDAKGPNADAPAPAASDGSTANQPTPAPVEQLPDGAELLAASVEASGGVDEIAKFETIHIEGVVKADKQNLEGTMQLWWRKDGNVYLEQNITGIGRSRVGYDGETIWLDEPISGLRKLEGTEATAYIQSSWMFQGHAWERYYSAANTLAKQRLADGSGEVWEVELVSKGGPNLTLGLDTQTKLIRYAKSVQPSILGDMPVDVVSDGYELVEGYKFSMHRTNTLGKLIVLDEQITKFEVNVPVDEAMFGFPSTREVVPADPNEQPAIEKPAPKTPAPEK